MVDMVVSFHVFRTMKIFIYELKYNTSIYVENLMSIVHFIDYNNLHYNF